jgi:1-acyl-sn-glycerol-3-phosphate acyltransferase
LWQFESGKVEAKETAMKNHKSLALIGLFGTLLAVWIFRQPIAAGMAWISNREAVAASVKELGLWGPAIVFVLLLLQVFLAFIPGQALMVTCGYLYGFWGGLFITWLGLVTGGHAAFLLARRYGRPFAERWISPDTLARWDKASHGQGMGFFALSLVLPVFPNDAMCYVAGLGKIMPRRFLYANMLGRGISCLLANLAGAYGSRIPLWGWALGIGLILAACVAWWMMKRNKSIPQGHGKEDRHIRADERVRRILKVCARLFNRSYIVSGHTSLPKGAKIIAMNHTHGCDPFHLPAFLDETPYFLLQDGLFEIPVVGQMLKQAGQIPVYRDSVKAKEALARACELLRQGKTIVIFPEGKQAPAGERLPAKTGAVRMALETGAPIIPLGLYAPPENLISLRFNWKGRQRSGLWQFSGKSYMRFGPPWRPGADLPVTDQPDVHALSEDLMNQIYRLVTEIQKEIPCESHFSRQSIRPWSVEHLS